PPAEFPGSNSWGYNPALPMAVETTYGGPIALRALVDAAHARGIAILVDVVYNHFGGGDLTYSLCASTVIALARAASISTPTRAGAHRGDHAPTSGAPRYGNISPTRRSPGCAIFAPTACAGTRPSTFASSPTGPTTPTAGASCKMRWRRFTP